ncbi:phospholipase A and acyltransferase 3-like isoform X1 [Hemicordylus capensis]|uniref:phospholipase A and acyltransferase 3-like isoform X1 n=1 Tax=Hemicordylus capensis TaxID=884348 RepID=UPI002303ABE2|nr:phospholipase A and acyltransferase 3-like isoform X1 [Hemicordylus capensis]XP_053151298.1 phospholipase A and acyltransferase 3-like isoform X1 [Hemicordylus capensis]XP_053151299.1 phospholipase A and acyltransferase 3-like isoform X1 [Hemicordylus capensis]
MGLEGKNPKPGDLIEIFRGLYKHWAIYIGGGFVVHVTSADGIAGVCSSCSPSVPAQKAVVKKELLKDVVGPNRAWVNNVNDTKSNPRAVEEILRDAKNYLGREISYNLIMSNCHRRPFHWPDPGCCSFSFDGLGSSMINSTHNSLSAQVSVTQSEMWNSHKNSKESVFLFSIPFLF